VSSQCAWLRTQIRLTIGVDQPIKLLPGFHGMTLKRRAARGEFAATSSKTMPS
jgi:hypothetical protein